MLIKLGVVALSLLAVDVQAAKKKDYENFSLPSKGMSEISVPEVHSNYLKDRLSIRRGSGSFRTPNIDSKQFLFAKEAYLAEKRDEAIKLLRQQLDSGHKQNRDNILLRLGQLYSEKYMELSYRENEYYTLQLQEFEKKNAGKKDAKRPPMDSSRSARYLKDALGLFTSLEKEYPRHPKMDEVVFFIGFVEMESGNEEKGRQYLERVIRTYPRSKKFDEAVVYLADHYFDKHKFKDATAKYCILLVRKSSDLYDYAIYKLAWCQLNTGEQKKALNDMKALITRLQGTQDKAKFNLREQALRDLVIFYGEVEDVDGAMAYFTDMQGREKALENLKLLADILRSKGHDEAAIKAYARLLEEFPDSLEAPGMALGLFEAETRLGRTDKSVNTLVNALDRYGAVSEWAKNYPKEKAAELKGVLDGLQADAEKAAFFFHQTAQKSSNKGSYSHALRIYTALLRNFPNDPGRKKIAFFRAEILFADGKWLDSANGYMDAAKVPPKDKMTDEAVYNALLALDRLTAKNEKIERYNKDEMKNVSLELKEIPSDEQRFVEVGEFYIKEYPQGQRIVDVRFRIAAIYYRYHHFDRSLEIFKEIALKHSKHRSAMTAAHIVLDIYNIKKDYPSLDASANLFVNTPGLGDAEFKKEMAAISGEIGFKKVESLEGQNKWKEAGESYLKFYQANPASPLAEKALYNAYVSFEKAGDTARSAETSRIFVAKYPKSEYAQKMSLSQAKLAEKQYDFEQAQRLYGDFYKKFPKDKEARKALYNAAVYAELLEQNKQAQSLYAEYLKDKSIPDAEKKAINLSLAKIHRKEGEWDKVTLIYRRMARNAGSVEAKLEILGELGRQYERGGKMTERNNIMNEIRWQAGQGKVKVSGQAAKLVAEAQFRAVAPQREKYDAVTLRFPAEDLLYLMKRKQKLLTRLSDSYDAVVGIGVPEWGVAALLEKSLAYEDFVKSYRAVKIPAGYKAEMKDEAEKGLKQLDAQIVQPLENKSQEILKVCVAKAAEFHVASEYAAKCRSRIKKTGEEAEPSGLLPQPNYWSTRTLSEGVAKQ